LGGGHQKKRKTGNLFKQGPLKRHLRREKEDLCHRGSIDEREAVVQGKTGGEKKRGEKSEAPGGKSFHEKRAETEAEKRVWRFVLALGN